jgi:GMP synthase (glutamine-hydrolysing)
VAAALCQKALGDKFLPFFVDHGLLRKDEGDEVQQRLAEHIPGLNLKMIDVSEKFFEELKGEE